MFATGLVALVAGFLFGKIFIHEFTLLTGAEHVLQRGIDAAFGVVQGEREFIAAFREGLVIFAGLGGFGSGATLDEPRAQILHARAQFLTDFFEPVERLLAERERLGVSLHGDLFLPLAQRANGFEGETK